MKSAKIHLETLGCPLCMQKIEAAVKKLDGIDKESVEAIYHTSIIKLKFDEGKISLGDIEGTINSMGFEVNKSQIT
ncbi:MAG TPA: metal-binding protein [Clostridiales bacterium UBA9856]|jgi:copper chaperone|nr:metal-binding protein [Clostridiales bacterium UBA9856]